MWRSVATHVGLSYRLKVISLAGAGPPTSLSEPGPRVCACACVHAHVCMHVYALICRTKIINMATLRPCKLTPAETLHGVW